MWYNKKRGVRHMRNKGKKFRDYVMRFSYREKRKRELENFRKEVQRLRCMDKDELNFEYIELKAEYEHRKSVLTLFVISILLSILMNAWGKFFSFMKSALQYTAGDSSTEVMMVSFWIAVCIIIFITIIILFVLFTLSNDMKKLRRRLMIIQSVIEEKKVFTEDH